MGEGRVQLVGSGVGVSTLSDGYGIWMVKFVLSSKCPCSQPSPITRVPCNISPGSSERTADESCRGEAPGL